MEAIGRIEIAVKDLDAPFHLYAMGDVHEGNAGCSRSTLRRVIERIDADKLARIVLLGDLCDFISVHDPRFDATCVEGLDVADLADMGHVLLSRFKEEIAPLKGRILAAAHGNHEASYMRATSGAGMFRRFCADIGCGHLALAGMFDLVLTKGKRSEVFRVFVHHGSGAAATPGGKINRLVRFMDMAECDIALCGHTHEQLEYVRTKIAANEECSHLTHIDQVGVVCGSFLRTYAQGVSGYGERAGYHPTSIGSPCIEIVPSTRAIGVNWLRG